MKLFVLLIITVLITVSCSSVEERPEANIPEVILEYVEIQPEVVQTDSGLLAEHRSADDCSFLLGIMNEGNKDGNPDEKWIAGVYFVDDRLCQVYDVMLTKGKYEFFRPSEKIQVILEEMERENSILGFDVIEEGRSFKVW